MKIKIDLLEIFMQIIEEMKNSAWHTLKCPQVVHFQVPHDRMPNISNNIYKIRFRLNTLKCLNTFRNWCPNASGINVRIKSESVSK